MYTHTHTREATVGGAGRPWVWSNAGGFSCGLDVGLFDVVDVQLLHVITEQFALDVSSLSGGAYMQQRVTCARFDQPTLAWRRMVGSIDAENQFARFVEVAVNHMWEFPTIGDPNIVS